MVFNSRRRTLDRSNVARVAADPPVHPDGDAPAGSADFIYYRLHGAPQVYYSRYAQTFLKALQHKIEATSPSVETWCIFDNTAAGHAIENALELHR